jgi:hypothetical protein
MPCGPPGSSWVTSFVVFSPRPYLTVDITSGHLWTALEEQGTGASLIYWDDLSTRKKVVSPLLMRKSTPCFGFARSTALLNSDML